MYRKRTMVSTSKKILFVIAALPSVTTAYAGNDARTVARYDTAHSQMAQHEPPKHPKKGWKISDRDYAELMDDCGESDDSAVDNPVRPTGGKNLHQGTE